MSDEQESMNFFGDMHPYNDRFKVFSELPEKGRDEEEVLKEIGYMSEKENKLWQGGQCSGTMYHGGMEHYAFLNEVFSMFSYVNMLQRDICPSMTKFEAEVLAMVGKMLHGDEVSKVNPYDEEAGAVTSGGTDSIFNAMFAYREWGRETKGITAAEVIAPTTIHPAHVKAAHYLGTQFSKSGWVISGQLVSAWGKVYRNVVATRYPSRAGQGGELPPLLIGAHYDTVSGSPGADDNASGLVVLLEVASRLVTRPLARPIWLVAFCLEEQNRLGSQAFASRLKAEGRELAGAIVLECVGFSRSEDGTQQVPPGVPFAVPSQGDFLAIVGNEASKSLVTQLEQEARRHEARLKPLSFVVPGRGEALPHTRRSDHASFWDAGYPAVMLTDTANFRNPHYHRETDTVDTLNLEFLSDVAATVTATAIQIAGVHP